MPSDFPPCEGCPYDTRECEQGCRLTSAARSAILAIAETVRVGVLLRPPHLANTYTFPVGQSARQDLVGQPTLPSQQRVEVLAGVLRLREV